ncbi:MAG TPA: hypothetical protein VN615_16075 [Gaiellales bacterium]|nr:hypothetical protein [Gaiellales bacterium]
MLSVRVLGSAALAALVACVAAAGSPAKASAATCNYTQVSQVFAKWNDLNYYTPFQGSSFENGASGWSWGNGAKIVSGDSNPLLGATGTHSVELPGGATARSPWMCVNASTPSMRFFVRRVSGTGSLTVNALITSGGRTVSTISRFSGSGSWQPSPVVVFPAYLTASSTGVNVQFQFTSDAGTVYRIDDVELDPYLRK